MITKKDLNEAIETAVGQISGAILKALENVASKDDVIKVVDRLGKVENRLGSVEDRLGRVETELVYVKGTVRDLKADTPTAKEFNHHEKRIRKLEKATFATQ